MTRPTVTDPLSGEQVGLDELQRMVIDTLKRLEYATRSVIALERQRAIVKLHYDRTYGHAVRASSGSSDEARRADGMAAVSAVRLTEGPYAGDVDLATRLYVIDGELKAMKAAGHDERARLRSLENLSANLRTQMRAEMGPMA